MQFLNCVLALLFWKWCEQKEKKKKKKKKKCHESNFLGFGAMVVTQKWVSLPLFCFNR
jgi:hypothetical protein